MAIDGSILQFRDELNGNATVYPLTHQNAVLGEDSQPLQTYITEYNVSQHHTNTDGTRVFTLSDAIAAVPDDYKRGGLKLSFNSNNGSVETYVLDSSVWSDNVSHWKQFDVNKLSELDDKLGGLVLTVLGNTTFSGKHGTYINFNIKKGVPLKITNTCTEVVKLYFRKAQSSIGQEQVDAIVVNGSVNVTPSDDYSYIYIYNPEDTGYNITFTIETDECLAKEVESNSNEIDKAQTRIAQIENGIIDYIMYTLRGTEQSRIVLNNAIVLSKDGDELSFDYIVDCDGNQELSFAASGLEGSPTYNYAIRLGKSTIRLRGSEGWMQASVVTFTERTKGKMRIVYADSKIYIYIDDILVDTVDTQSTLTVKGFGYGGNHTATYGYWKGSIYNLKHNGVAVNLENSSTLQDVDKFVIYKFSEKKKSTLTWDASTKMFTHYELEESTNRYFSFSMQLKENNEIYLKEWRLVDGGCYYWDGTSFVKLFSTIYNAENEMAMMFSAGNYNGGYTGGSHGGEKIDTNANCFAKFFADGKLLTDNDLLQSFSMDCDEFSYIQVSTLHDSDSNNSVRAYHTKVNHFSDCGFHLENTIKFTGSNTVYQFHAGLFCVAKDSATNTFVPTKLLQTLSGGDTIYRADGYNSTEIIFYNPTNNVKVSVTGRFLEGFTFGDALPSSGLFGVWDRSTDSKYYRRTNDSYPFSEGDIIRNEQIVKYK